VKVRSEYSQSEQEQIDLNLCDSVSLVKLPGIGPVLSARIIKYRHLLGGFARVDQLMDVYGLPGETFDLIKGRLFADSTIVKRINVNSAGFNYKSRIPYLERSEVSAILKYRELNGKISGVSDLIENKLITAEKARKAGPYLEYDE
jgi:DNA uptake protein ComE-like DNA-binding protein